MRRPAVTRADRYLAALLAAERPRGHRHTSPAFWAKVRVKARRELRRDRAAARRMAAIAAALAAIASVGAVALAPVAWGRWYLDGAP